MLRAVFILPLLCLGVPFLNGQGSSAPSQTPKTESSASLPSPQEIAELVSKADERVSDFQNALDSLKPMLAKVDPETFRQDSDACEAARVAILAIKKNGPSAYALVDLISTLDDLSLDASRLTTRTLILAIQDLQADGRNQSTFEANIMRITQAGQATYDISELLLHTTLRYIAVEESQLNKAKS
jgi:hypothetical protein